MLSLSEKQCSIMENTILTLQKGSKLQTEKNDYLHKEIEKLIKDITHWGYLTADIDQKATDAVIKKKALLHLPFDYTPDMIYDILIDRKQGKMVLLMK